MHNSSIDLSPSNYVVSNMASLLLLIKSTSSLILPTSLAKSINTDRLTHQSALKNDLVTVKLGMSYTLVSHTGEDTKSMNPNSDHTVGLLNAQ